MINHSWKDKGNVNRKPVSGVSQILQDAEREERERHSRLKRTCTPKHGGRKLQAEFRRP